MSQTPSGRPSTTYSVDHPAQPASRHASVSSRRSMLVTGAYDPTQSLGDVDEDEDIPVGHHFSIIPPNPRKYYKRLLENCLIADLERMLSPEVDDAEEVSLGILSPPHIELINECALRWRINQSYRVSCFVDLVRQFFERGEVPMECIPDAVQNVIKALEENEIDNWPVQDVGALSRLVPTNTKQFFRLITFLVYTGPSLISSCPLFITLWMRYPISNPRISAPSYPSWKTSERAASSKVSISMSVRVSRTYRIGYGRCLHCTTRQRCRSCNRRRVLTELCLCY